MGYDRGDSFPSDSEHKWNSILFRKSKGKLSSRSYPIQCERKWKYSYIRKWKYSFNLKRNVNIVFSVHYSESHGTLRMARDKCSSQDRCAKYLSKKNKIDLESFFSSILVNKIKKTILANNVGNNLLENNVQLFGVLIHF